MILLGDIGVGSTVKVRVVGNVISLCQEVGLTNPMKKNWLPSFWGRCRTVASPTAESHAACYGGWCCLMWQRHSQYRAVLVDRVAILPEEQTGKRCHMSTQLAEVGDDCNKKNRSIHVSFLVGWSSGGRSRSSSTSRPMPSVCSRSDRGRM